MSIVSDFAKAVASELNKGKFSEDFEAIYTAKPWHYLKDLETLRVVVVPKKIETERVSRAETKYTVSLDIGIMKRTGDMTQEERIAETGTLVDDIMVYLMEHPLTDCPYATVKGVTNDPIYTPDLLNTTLSFLSCLTVKYVFCV